MLQVPENLLLEGVAPAADGGEIGGTSSGLTIEKLIRTLGLDKPPLADRMAEAEARLGAKRSALTALPGLQQEGTFSARTCRRGR